MKAMQALLLAAVLLYTAAVLWAAFGWLIIDIWWHG
jgi:hypothetical protein